ncbi:hypothetical protein PC110_g23094 [Phytophthora cactorum]|uniref:Uncharacterized protein n=1 Tax=Phytophthora cactorum TaxID=29920 RepID=A0A329R7B3_9STRA|nr:hypothetical protein PC110_g23094 [Phytophthora cactorum]
MPISGTLTFKVEHVTKFKKHDAAIDENVKLYINGVPADAKLTIEVLQEKRKKALVDTTQPLSEFFKSNLERKMTFIFGPKATPNTMLLYFSVDWEPNDTSLAVIDTHRRWFMRASYYYKTSKNVYDYTASFRVVKPFDRLGEATVNTVLATVTGKTLFDVDQSLVVPVLDSVDNKVDATIYVAFTKLYEGQQFAVKTKNKAVNAVSNVAHKTGNTAVRATNYTTNKVASATGAVYGAVTGTADYASSQVKNASSSTYGAVRGVTYSVASHTLLLGPKIRA